MKLLLALDGSSGSDAVLREVASRPWPTGSECCVMTAIDPFFFTKAPLILAEAKKDAQTMLDESAESLKQNRASAANRNRVGESTARNSTSSEGMECGPDFDGVARKRRVRKAAGGEHGASGFAARDEFGGDRARGPAKKREM